MLDKHTIPSLTQITSFQNLLEENMSERISRDNQLIRQRLADLIAATSDTFTLDDCEESLRPYLSKLLEIAELSSTKLPLDGNLQNQTKDTIPGTILAELFVFLSKFRNQVRKTIIEIDDEESYQWN